MGLVMGFKYFKHPAIR